MKEDDEFIDGIFTVKHTLRKNRCVFISTQCFFIFIEQSLSLQEKS